MKYNLPAVIVLVTLLFSSHTLAEESLDLQGKGKILFKGTVIKAPCGLAPGEDGDNQQIDMGQVSDAQLRTIGYSKPKNFRIHLIGCYFAPSVTTGVKVNVRFDGLSVGGSDGYLGVTGEAKGLAIRFVDSSNVQVKIGTTSDNYTLNAGDTPLLFSAQVVKLDGENIIPGSYSALTNFSLTYL